MSRGLELLLAIAQRGPTSLNEAHKLLGVSKPTALRALHALEHSSLLSRRLGDDAYVISAHARRLLTHEDMPTALAGASPQVLRALASRVPWPADVGTREGAGIVVVDSNRRLLKWPHTLRVIGHRPHMLWSAMGRIHMACCPREERDEMIAALRKKGGADVRRFLDAGLLEGQISEVRRLGYARRDPRQPTIDAESRDPQEAIAVPIWHDGQLFGCMNCVWIAARMSEKQFIASYLPALNAAAGEIAKMLGAD